MPVRGRAAHRSSPGGPAAQPPPLPGPRRGSAPQRCYPTDLYRKHRDSRRQRSGATTAPTSRPPPAVRAPQGGISFPADPTETRLVRAPRSPPPRRRRLFPGSAAAGRAGRASCALKAINTIRGIFNCSIKHAVNNYSQLC